MLESIRQELRDGLAAFHEKHHERVNSVLAQHTKLVEHEQTIDAAHARLLQVEVSSGYNKPVYNNNGKNNACMNRLSWMKN